MFQPQPLEVFLVEDNEGDVNLVRRSVAECDRTIELTVARNGEEALRVMKTPAFSPDLVILDLNLPKVSGFEVLERSNTLNTPVVVFSSACNSADVQRALSLRARECVRKPMDVGDFIGAVCGMIESWAIRRRK